MNQTWDVEKYEKNARFVSIFGQSLIEYLSPQSNESILDIGCGDGYLTDKLSQCGATVLGIDQSFEFIQAAKQRKLNVRQLDAYDLDYQEAFDSVFSNAALHWMKKNPKNLFKRIFKSLKPHGRFVVEMGGMGNVATLRVPLHALCQHHQVDPQSIDPWWFPSETECRYLLEENGFIVDHMESFYRPTPLPGDVSEWLETMAGPFLIALPLGSFKDDMDYLRQLLKPALCDEQGQWVIDYVRLRFKAIKPA